MRKGGCSLRHPSLRWGLVGEALLRLFGTVLAAYIIRYMCLGYLSGKYLRGDQILTLITIMIFVAVFVFSLVISISVIWKRIKDVSRPSSQGPAAGRR